MCLSVTTYDEGNTVRLEATFKNAANALTDPGTVTLKTEDQAGVVNTYTWAGGGVTRASVGVFYRDVVTIPGKFEYWFAGATGVTAAKGGEFSVTPALV